MRIERHYKRYIAIHDGKLLREFEKLYDALHIGGYYRGLIYDVGAVKAYIKAAEEFIKIAPENPVLWTGMKGASAESRKKQTRC